MRPKREIHWLRFYSSYFIYIGFVCAWIAIVDVAVVAAQENESASSQLNETQSFGVAAPESESSLGVSLDPFEYEQRGRRDPFVRPIEDRPAAPGQLHGPLLPLQRFELNQLALVGIIWDVRRPKAMLRDPAGNTHIVGPNAKVGPRNGYIAVIREGEIVVVETIDQQGKLSSSAQVVKIAK